MTDYDKDGQMVREAKDYRQKRRTYWYVSGGLCCAGSTCMVSFMILLVAIGVAVGFKMTFGWGYAKKAIDASTMTVKDWHIHHFTDSGMFCDLNGIVNTRAPLAVRASDIDITMEYNQQPFATFQQPAMNMNAGSTALQLKNIFVTVTDKALFKAFAADLMRSERVSIKLKGDVSLSMGIFSFSGLPMNVDTYIDGFQQFNKEQMKAVNPKFIGYDENKGLILDFYLDFKSYAAISFPARKLSANVRISYNDELITLGVGNSVSKTVFIRMGRNRVHMQATLSRDGRNRDAFDMFMSEYINRRDFNLVIEGRIGDADVADDLMRGAMTALKSTVFIPKIDPERSLFQDNGYPINWNWKDCLGDAKACPFAKKECENVSTHHYAVTDNPTFLKRTAVVDGAVQVIQNPFDMEMIVKKIDMTVFWHGGPQIECRDVLPKKHGKVVPVEYAKIQQQESAALNFQSAERKIVVRDMCYLDSFADLVQGPLMQCATDVVKNRLDPIWPVLMDFTYTGIVNICLGNICMDLPYRKEIKTMSTFHANAPSTDEPINTPSKNPMIS